MSHQLVDESQSWITCTTALRSLWQTLLPWAELLALGLLLCLVLTYSFRILCWSLAHIRQSVRLLRTP